ncbi:hypothetical protein SLEP1_g12263 [Rubroshorea leprosula]|uniref:Uncharacterized protein n=1 Tax=Rubroshorea leprosula TaxID=152421 RepID=A0AAV5IMN7_9ROSI|nr:hypothetical protein SLEP1_g12263 [Rubroshorea leprosula]
MEGLSSAPICNIYCKAAPTLFVSMRNGKVALAPANVNDKYRQWCKVEKSQGNNNEGSGFSLVNKATLLAIKHAAVNRPVEVTPPENTNDESILWTECTVGDADGYKSITMVNNTKLCWDVYGGDVKDGASIGIDYWSGKDTERWLIAPCAPPPPEGPLVSIYCQAGPNYSVSVGNNRVVLASADPSDKCQQWYRVESSTQGKKSCGFALVNCATGQAIKHPAANQPQADAHDNFVCNICSTYGRPIKRTVRDKYPLLFGFGLVSTPPTACGCA